MSKFTKIVATISDKRCDVDFIRSLYHEGMNVVRMNSAHLNREGFLKIINNVREVSENIALLIDTKGPEIRTTVAENDRIEIKLGEIIKVVGNPEIISTNDCIYVSYPHFVRDLHVGDDILFDDGEIDLKVESKTDDYLLCRALNGGVLGSRKSVNVPGVRINLPSITEKDRENILFAIEQDIDFIAHSFVRSKEDLMVIQQILDTYESPIKIISKIENQEGVDKIEEIIEHSYGIMIARGDLGIEVGQEKIPGIQRRLIRKCVMAKKTVIVATQMLHSMINHPRPTRAEVTDIANAIYYRTDALMLSGETAFGKYPIEAVQTMSKIAEEAEKTKLTENDIPVPLKTNDIRSFLSHAAMQASEQVGTKAVLTDSYTGKTVLNLSAFRGTNPIIANCCSKRLVRELGLSYGVFPTYQRKCKTTKEYFFSQLEILLERGKIKHEDYVCHLSGSFASNDGTTFLEINQVKKILENEGKYDLPNF